MSEHYTGTEKIIYRGNKTPAPGTRLPEGEEIVEETSEAAPKPKRKVAAKRSTAAPKKKAAGKVEKK